MYNNLVYLNIVLCVEYYRLSMNSISGERWN